MIRHADSRPMLPRRPTHPRRLMSHAPDPAIGQPIDRAAAALPANLLSDNEIVILLLKPSPWYILLESLGSLAVLGVIIAALAFSHEVLGWDFISRRTLILTAAVLGFIRLAWQFLEWLSRTYVLTDRRVFRIRGVVQVEVFQAPLARLQHTGLSFTLRERLFGLGTIAFATAGSAYPEAYWVMLRRPIQVHKQVLDAIDRYGGGGMRRARLEATAVEHADGL